MPRTAAEPSSPPPAGDQARPQRRQRVKVPLRLVVNPHYADVAVTAYVKIGALASRPEGCTAATVTIAEYVGLSKASVELRHDAADAPRARRCRRAVLDPPFPARWMWHLGGAPYPAALPGRAVRVDSRRGVRGPHPRASVRAYALIAYAQAQKIPLTESEIAGALHHHIGRRSGQPLTTAAAGEIVDELEATRWITVERRAGVRGRHHFVAHDIPPATQDPGCGQLSSTDVAPSSTSGPGEGSGSSAGEGSLATKEEPRTDRPDDERALFSPAVGEVQVGEGVENRDAQPPRGTDEDGLALRADDHQTPLTTPLTRPSGTPLTNPTGAYSGPRLTISARVHDVLEPVHWLYRQTSVYMQRRIAREVGQQLRSGVDDTRLRQRLQTRVAQTFTDEIRDPGRWILGVGLPHWGCGIFDCEAGVLWSSGRRCLVCEEIVRDRRRATAQPEAPAPGIVHSVPARVPVQPSTPAAPRGRCPECGLRRPGAEPPPSRPPGASRAERSTKVDWPAARPRRRTSKCARDGTAVDAPGRPSAPPGSASDAGPAGWSGPHPEPPLPPSRIGDCLSSAR
uniref:Uncharacterized protein n=1 Tax=Streptomyces sp. 44414 TaxID=364103 RepID=Q0GC35_9ACTN|nr:unknown [Streptomyces sp. 44414]